MRQMKGLALGGQTMPAPKITEQTTQSHSQQSFCDYENITQERFFALCT